ncbi:MAG: AsmA-like C-terminal region-containing protein, partial [Candidatus Binatia bacterium]
RLAAWLGQPLKQPDPGPLKVRAELGADGAKVTLKEATINGKALKAKASGSFDGSNPVAVFKANVDIEQMDLNAYLPPEKKKKAKVRKRATAKKAAQKKPGGWSEEPFDLTPLSKAKGDIQVKIASVRYRDLIIQSGRMATTLVGGILKTSIDELKMADGTVSASATLDGSGSGASIDYQVSIAGVKAMPMLKAFAGTDRLSGKVQFEAKGKAKGGNQKEFVSSLNGDGRFKFLDGAIHGINLAASLRKVKTLGFGGGEKEKTDFAEISGSFVIKQGVLDNRDFKMLAPLIRLSGEGFVPMPPRTIDYQVEAKLVASLSGQGGGDAMAGLPIPIRLKGPWDKVDYKVDWKSFFGLAAKDPTRLKNMPKDLRAMGEKFGVPLTVPGTEKLGGLLEKIPGFSTGKKAPESSGEQPEQEKASSETDPLKSLKGLFGR